MTSVPLKAVFTSAYGSQFGDFDAPNDVMRAILAARDPELPGSFKGGYGLTSSYDGGSFQWNLMGTGETVGASHLASQNAPLVPGSAQAWIYYSLMGDPTLRLDVTLPPTNVVASVNKSSQAVLCWTAPSTIPDYYDVYRATSSTGPFIKVNAGAVHDTTFTDTSTAGGTYVYMVRAIKLTTTPNSSSYYSPSQGAFAAVSIGGTPALAVAPSALDSIAFAGAGGVDPLVLDLPAGSFAPRKGLTLFAEGGAEDDMLSYLQHEPAYLTRWP
jgi:hypothetical protein